MRVVQMTRPGGPEVLQLETVADLTPGPGQVLVQVSAAGVNYADALARAGAYPLPGPLPAVLGNEVVGVVAAHGPGVSTPAVGSRVAAFIFSGGYAEQVVADAASLVLVPPDIDDATALALLLQGLTAAGLLDVAGVRAGQTVVVTAAAGGVGHLAVQLATLAGARVIGLASPDKLDVVRDLGADLAVDYTTAGWEQQVKDSAGDGVDVFLDSVGGPVLDAGIRLLAPSGRHLIFGFASGGVGQLTADQLASLIMRNAGVIGFSTGSLLPSRPDLFGTIPEMYGQVSAGTLRTLTGHRYPLALAGQAHTDISARRTTGKLVLTV